MDGGSAAPSRTTGVAAFQSPGSGAGGACSEQPHSPWLDAPIAFVDAGGVVLASGPQQQCPGVPIARHDSPAGSGAACAAITGAPWAAQAMASAGAPPMVETIARTSVNTSHRLLCRSAFIIRDEDRVGVGPRHYHLHLLYTPWG